MNSRGPVSGFYLWIYNKLLFWARATRLIQSTPIRSNKYVKMCRDNGPVPISHRISSCRLLELSRAKRRGENGTQILSARVRRSAAACSARDAGGRCEAWVLNALSHIIRLALACCEFMARVLANTFFIMKSGKRITYTPRGFLSMLYYSYLISIVTNTSKINNQRSIFLLTYTLIVTSIAMNAEYVVLIQIKYQSRRFVRTWQLMLLHYSVTSLLGLSLTSLLEKYVHTITYEINALIKVWMNEIYKYLSLSEIYALHV